jgi:hypothetical protein
MTLMQKKWYTTSIEFKLCTKHILHASQSSYQANQHNWMKWEKYYKYHNKNTWTTYYIKRLRFKDFWLFELSFCKMIMGFCNSPKTHCYSKWENVQYKKLINILATKSKWVVSLFLSLLFINPILDKHLSPSMTPIIIAMDNSMNFSHSNNIQENSWLLAKLVHILTQRLQYRIVVMATWQWQT